MKVGARQREREGEGLWDCGMQNSRRDERGNARGDEGERESQMKVRSEGERQQREGRQRGGGNTQRGKSLAQLVVERFNK